MMYRSSVLSKLILYAIAPYFLFISCKSESVKEEPAVEVVENDANASKLVKIGNTLFSVPSPIQIANMIRESGANYSTGVLNPTRNHTNYTTNFSKAINLGIYGANLGYVTIYDQTQDALDYLSVIKKLSDELGISGAFEKATMERFQKNIGKKDSILAIITEGFRSSDKYLKNSERKDMGTLIVAGGWIEGLYYATSVAQTNDYQELKNRIGDQKVTLENLIKLLMEFEEQEEVGKLIDKLLDLSNTFGNVEFTYSYKEPTIDTAKKITIINSISQVKMSKEQLAEITNKVKEIRNELVK